MPDGMIGCDRWIKAEVAVMLALMMLGVRWLPLRTVRRLAPRAGAGDLSASELALARNVGKLAATLYSGKWAEHQCLARCLAAKAVLARRGIGTTITLGIRRLGIADEFDVPDMRRDYGPHAWLETDTGEMLLPKGTGAWQVVGKLD